MIDNVGGLGGSEGEILKNLLDQLKQDDSVVRVQLNDQRLMKLAEYDATHGYMVHKVEPEELQGRFNELKGLVKKGEFTLKTLEDDVYARWGITEEPREDVLRKASEAGIQEKPSIGFNGFEVADLKEDDPKNH